MSDVATKQDLKELEGRLKGEFDEVKKMVIELGKGIRFPVNKRTRIHESSSHLLSATQSSALQSENGHKYEEDEGDFLNSSFGSRACPLPIARGSLLPHHVGALQQEGRYIVDELDVTDDFLDALRSANVLDESDVGSVKAKGKRSDRGRRLLSRLVSKSPEIFENGFIPVLSKHQTHVAKKLMETVTERQQGLQIFECLFCQLVRQVEPAHIGDAFHSKGKVDVKVFDFLSNKTILAHLRWGVVHALMSDRVWNEELHGVLLEVVKGKNSELAEKLGEEPEVWMHCMACACRACPLQPALSSRAKVANWLDSENPHGKPVPNISVPGASSKNRPVEANDVALQVPYTTACDANHQSPLPSTPEDTSLPYEDSLDDPTSKEGHGTSPPQEVQQQGTTMPADPTQQENSGTSSDAFHQLRDTEDTLTNLKDAAQPHDFGKEIQEEFQINATDTNDIKPEEVCERADGTSHVQGSSHGFDSRPQEVTTVCGLAPTSQAEDSADAHQEPQTHVEATTKDEADEAATKDEAASVCESTESASLENPSSSRPCSFVGSGPSIEPISAENVSLSLSTPSSSCTLMQEIETGENAAGGMATDFIATPIQEKMRQPENSTQGKSFKSLEGQDTVHSIQATDTGEGHDDGEDFEILDKDDGDMELAERGDKNQSKADATATCCPRVDRDVPTALGGSSGGFEREIPLQKVDSTDAEESSQATIDATPPGRDTAEAIPDAGDEAKEHSSPNLVMVQSFHDGDDMMVIKEDNIAR